MSRFIRALKKKGHTPASALAALGLDTSYLRGDDADDDFAVPEGSPGIARKVETMPQQNLGAEDDGFQHSPRRCCMCPRKFVEAQQCLWKILAYLIPA
jgi:hypothetical protein